MLTEFNSINGREVNLVLTVFLDATTVQASNLKE